MRAQAKHVKAPAELAPTPSPSRPRETKKSTGRRVKSALTYPGTLGWIVILSIVLIVVDLSLFFAYRATVPSQGLASQTVGFLESGVFNGVTLGFLAPILIGLLNHLFNIGDAVQQRIANQRHDRRNELGSAIENTADGWNDLFRHCGKVVFCTGRGDAPEIRALREEKALLESKAEETVTAWDTRFREQLGESQPHIFLTLINTMLRSEDTVLAKMEECDGSSQNLDEISELQACLDFIRQGIKDVLHVQMLAILNIAADLQTLDLRDEDRILLSGDVRRRIAVLKSWSDAIVRWTVTSNTLMPEAEGEPVILYRKTARTYLLWRRSNPDAGAKGRKEHDDMVDAFDGIPSDQFCKGSRSMLSADCVRHLARRIRLQLTIYELDSEAQGLPSGS